MNRDYREITKYFQILEVNWWPYYPTWDGIEEGYKKMRIKYHPDKLRQRLHREPTEQEKEKANQKFQSITEAYNILKEEYKGNPEINLEIKEFSCDFCGRIVRLREDFVGIWKFWKEKKVRSDDKSGYIWCCGQTCLEKTINCYECGEIGKSGNNFKHSNSLDIYYCEPCYSKLESCIQCQKKLTVKTIWHINKESPERFCSENCALEWVKKHRPKNTETDFYYNCKICSKRFSYVCDNEEKARQELDRQRTEHYLLEHPETAPETTSPPVSQQPPTQDNFQPIPQTQQDNSNDDQLPEHNNENNDQQEKITTKRQKVEQNIKEILKKYHVDDKELKDANWQEYLQNLDSEEKIDKFVKKIELGVKKLNSKKNNSQNPKSNELSKGAKIGITIGVASGVLFIVGIIIVKFRKQKR